MSAKNPLPKPSLVGTDVNYQPPRARRHGAVLSLDELWWARHAVAETIVRRGANEPVRPELRNVLARLDDLLLIDGLFEGTEFDSGLGQSEEWITVAEAAVILGCSREYVGRIAETLGGRKRGRQWEIPHRNVIEHLQGKEAS